MCIVCGVCAQTGSMICTQSSGQPNSLEHQLAVSASHKEYNDDGSDRKGDRSRDRCDSPCGPNRQGHYRPSICRGLLFLSSVRLGAVLYICACVCPPVLKIATL